MCAARMLQKLLEKYNRSSPRLTGAGGLSPDLADRLHSTTVQQQAYSHSRVINTRKSQTHIGVFQRRDRITI